MIAGSTFLAVMVLTGLAVTIVAPFLLLVLWIRDWKAQKLW